MHTYNYKTFPSLVWLPDTRFRTKEIAHIVSTQALYFCITMSDKDTCVLKPREKNPHIQCQVSSSSTRLCAIECILQLEK